MRIARGGRSTNYVRTMIALCDGARRRTISNEAAQKHLYNESRKAFYKGIRCRRRRTEPDETIDMSSIYGSFMYGLFGTKSEKTRNAVDAALRKHLDLMRMRLICRADEHDTYRRPDDTEQPNWWLVSLLWMAQYFLETDSKIA